MMSSRRGQLAGWAIAAPLSILVSVSACRLPGPSPSAALTTGVRGLVLAGPTCPVERVGASPCVRVVAGAEILARDGSGRIAARARSDGAGNYFLALAPGSYVVEPQPVGGLMGTAQPVAVEVTDGPPLELNLEYDTGIR
jgi:hypothetical protein